MAITVNVDKVRAEFFESIFGRNEGYICIAHAKANQRHVIDTYFAWPTDVAKMMKHIETVTPGHNVWFQAQLLDVPKRKKENVSTCYALWADLDACPPHDITPQPQVVLASSVGRWQALWRLERPVPAIMAEDFSRRIARAYKDSGVDSSGWDLTQLLRVPFTYNYKYPEHPVVDVEFDLEHTYTLKDFEGFEPVPHFSVSWVDPPQRSLNAQTVLDQYVGRMEQYVLDMYFDEPQPGADWSKVLWKLMQSLFDVGMNREEVYAVAATAACNKFLRDGNPERLWPDVLRAEAARDKARPIKATRLPEFNAEYHTGNTFIEQYADWAETRSDAPREYHEAGAFIILSTLLSTGLEVETSVDSHKTNLWVLILGETTLTRKTTAMRLAVKMIEEIDEDAVVATDGSIEGITSALSTRPHRASLFYRDEVSGMFKQTTRKDYLSGMLEYFTKMYDGDNVTRHLRKEVIRVRDPVFIFFGGGIKDATMFSLSEEHKTSGFIPRFLWVIGEADPERIRPQGPRTDESKEEENRLVAQLTEMHRNYTATQVLSIGGEKTEVPLITTAVLTADAWELYNSFAMTHERWALGHPERESVAPIMTRTSVSCLKMSALLAAARQEPSIDGKVMVEDTDVAHAIKYVRKWMPHSMTVIRDAGVSASESVTQRVLQLIERHPGIKRSQVSTNHHLNAKQMNNVQETLVDRQQIRVVKDGKTSRYYPMD